MTVRRTGITYPDGTNEIGISYTSTAAQSLSRPDGLTMGGSQISSYAYLGLWVFVNVTYDAASDLEWTAETGETGDAGDQYTALDRFGRLVETLWQTTGATQVHSKYGRNQVGGIVWRQDLAAAAAGVNTQDNFYWYDGLQQVTARQQGLLSGTAPNYTGIVSPPHQEEDFGYDPTGNWATYDILNPADSQTRTHNQANQITAITNSSVSSEPPVQYDPTGNMTLAPQPANWAADFELVYDAWNRLVRVTNASGSSTVATYAYDGLTRRIHKGTDTQIQDYYYSKDWQVLEARGVETVTSSSSEPTVPDVTQFVWGLRGRDNLILRTQVIAEGLLQQLYALDDQHSTVAITDQTAAVQERYGYDAFGTTVIMTPSFDFRFRSPFNWTTTFCSYDLDWETGLYQIRYRYLHPTLGRWLTRDPIAEKGGFNLYAYALENPINLFGLQSNPCPNAISGSGNLRLDDDGTGSAHYDTDHQNTTSLPGLNADTDSYIVAPESVYAQGVRVGDTVTVTANGHTITCRIGDFGPSANGWGEMSLAAAHNLGVQTTDVQRDGVGPVTDTNNPIPVTISVCPSGTP